MWMTPSPHNRAMQLHRPAELGRVDDVLQGFQKTAPMGVPRCQTLGNPTKSMQLCLENPWKSSIIWQMLLCYGSLLDYLLEGHHNKSMKSCPDDTLESYQKNMVSKLRTGAWRNMVRLPQSPQHWVEKMPWPWPGPAWNTALVSASHLWMAAKASSGKAAASWMDSKQLEKMWEIRCQTIDYYDYLWIGGY